MVTSGQHVGGKQCLEMGLVDELVTEGKLREGAIAFANKVIAEKRPLKKVRESNEKVEAARGKPEIFDNFRKANARKFRGFKAPESNIKAHRSRREPALRGRSQDGNASCSSN